MAEGKAFLAVNSNRPEISKTVVPDTDRWVIVILLSSYWGFFFVNEEFLMSRRKRWVRDPSKSVQTKRFKNFGQSYLLVRTRYLKELEELRQLGANEVVPEEFETSIEISALVLQTYKLSKDIILRKAEQIRREGYALLRRGELPELAHHLRAGTLMDVEVETCRIDEDSPALGKLLMELHIRPRTGASVIALTRSGITQSNPSEKTPLEQDDVLVLLGSRDQIRRAIGLLVDTKSD